MLHALLKATVVVSFAVSAYAQIFTTTNDLGLTVVEELTLNPQGIDTTLILSTLTGVSSATTGTSTNTKTATSTPTTALAATTAATTAAAPATTAPQIVEAPTSTVAAPTVYFYTTTNAAGATVQLTATFTPSFAPTTLPSYASTGTILQYSAWLSAVGTSTVPASGAAIARWRLDGTWLAVGAATLTAMLGGMLVTLV